DATDGHGLQVRARLRILRGSNDLQNVRADEHAIAFAQRALLHLLAVDERAVGGAQVFDADGALAERDPRALARDHLFDEHHVELARATDHDLLPFSERILSTLVLARDETERVPGLALGIGGAGLRVTGNHVEPGPSLRRNRRRGSKNFRTLSQIRSN